MTEPQRLITAEETPLDGAVDKALRPQSLAEFIGQRDLRENLSVFIQAAKGRGEALDHVLLAGPPGLGKTTLAQIVAKELGVGYRGTSGPVIARAGDLAAILTNLQPHDVLFIDEIHRLNAAVEEILYPAMEDGTLDLVIGEGPAARTVQIDLPPFTLVGATTRAGLLTAPLRARFGIPLRLDFYPAEELHQIVTRSAALLEMNLSEDGAMEIARRARGTPRIAGRLVRRVRDIASVSKWHEVNAEKADSALQKLEVDSHGLDSLDARYLKALGETFAGGPVGVETLCAVLAEEKDTVEDVVEPYLLRHGFIQRTPRGRVLTDKGYGHMGLAAPQDTQSTAAPLFSQS